MCRIFTVIGILINSFYFDFGCKAFDLNHKLQKRQTEYEVTVIDTDNLASGLQKLLSTVQQATNMEQQFQYQIVTNPQKNQIRGQNFPGEQLGRPRGPPDRHRGPPGGPPGRPDFRPPPGGPEYGPPGSPGYRPPDQHFGPPGFGRHPPPPPPPPHEGPRGFGRPPWGSPHWQHYRHHGPPGPPYNFGRPPPPFEGHHQHHRPPNSYPPNNYNNYQQENDGDPGQKNPGNIPVQNEDKDKKKIVGYFDGNFPIILLEDNEIRR